MAWNGSVIMTATTRFPSAPERLRRWLVPVTLLTLTPKCVLCVLAYTGLGAALGLGGPELCGAVADPSSAAVLPLLVALLTATGRLFIHRILNRPIRSKT
jgi:hypothetical protein